MICFQESAAIGLELCMVASNTYQWPLPYFLTKYYLSARFVGTVFGQEKRKQLSS